MFCSIVWPCFLYIRLLQLIAYVGYFCLVFLCVLVHIIFRVFTIQASIENGLHVKQYAETVAYYNFDRGIPREKMVNLAIKST